MLYGSIFPSARKALVQSSNTHGKDHLPSPIDSMTWFIEYNCDLQRDDQEHLPDDHEHLPDDHVHLPDDHEHFPDDDEHLPDDDEHLPDDDEHQLFDDCGHQLQENHKQPRVS